MSQQPNPIEDDMRDLLLRIEGNKVSGRKLMRVWEAELPLVQALIVLGQVKLVAGKRRLDGQATWYITRS